jgi:hypothetical protein
MNLQEARSQWLADRPMHEEAGLYALPSVQMYLPDEWKRNPQLALDAQPALSTDPSAAIPALLTTTIDPEVYRVAYAPLDFAEILTERRIGAWTDQTRMLPVVEETGEVSTYGDRSTSGRAGLNVNWPQVQAYLFQCFLEYGDLETERMGLAKISYVSELQATAADLLNRYQNFTYALGVEGLQCYGYINNPFLSAALTPAVKANGGTTWFTSGGSPNATPNEVYNDALALIQALIQQTQGTVKENSPMTLSLSPGSNQAFHFANSFGLFTDDLIKKGYPNLKIMTAPQYGKKTVVNFQGFSTAGNVMQLRVDEVIRQKVAYAAFNEKLRAGRIVPGNSSFSQKFTSGTWGTLTRMPVGVVTMIGI